MLATTLRKPIISSFIVFLCGSLCALAMAPYNVWAIFMVGFAALYWAVDHADSKKAAFGFGWLWAFGYFTFSLYWIGNALLVDGNPYKWAYPLAVCGLPALLALFNAFGCLFIKCFLNLKQWHGYLGFAAVLCVCEWLRGHLFTGFPWNLYGYTWIDFVEIAQLASYGSIYCLTFLTIFWLSVFGFMIATRSQLQRWGALSLCLITFLWSIWHGFGLIPARVLSHPINIKIVQPNTDQAEKWQRDKMDGHFENALALSRADDNDDGSKTLIIWPETTLSPLFLNAPYYRDRIATMLREYKGEAVLLTGALRKDEENYYNSLLSIDASGQIGRIYDKSHLVPFGEYIPFQDLIPLTPVTQFQGFQKGDGPTEVTLFEDISYSPLVCYEILFPDKIIPKNSSPDFIVNVTNDAWYGDSAGPRQHLVKAQFRAIEEGTPVLRAANTGISAVIDAHGNIIKASDTFAQKVITTKLPIKK